MSKDTLGFSVGYVLTAISSDSHKPGRVFLALDGYSGGYPYWANDFHSAERFNPSNASDITNLRKHYEDTCCGGTYYQGVFPQSARIVNAVVHLEPVADSDIDGQVRQNALNKLSDAEKRALGLEV